MPVLALSLGKLTSNNLTNIQLLKITLSKTIKSQNKMPEYQVAKNQINNTTNFPKK